MRGGARSGAGRKSPLTGWQSLQVGEHCETLWLQAAEAQALARYEELPKTKEIRAEQLRTEMIPMAARRRAKQSLQDIGESIDDITGGKRGVSLPLKRPYGAKAAVIKAAIAWCKAEYDQTITASKATECWKAYKRFQARAHGELSYRGEK